MSRYAGPGVFIIALSINFVILAEYRHSPFAQHPLWDAQHYLTWAKGILAGPLLGSEIFHHPPLYPYVLALILRIFGNTLLPVCIIQAVLSALSCFLLFTIGRRLAGTGIGILAGLLFAFYDQQVFHATKLLSETLAITLLLTMIAALAMPSKRRWLAIAGLSWALLCTARAHFLLLTPLLGVVLLMKMTELVWAERLRRVLVFVIPAAVILGGVGLRNFVVGGDLVLISDNGGENFYYGNNPEANGIFNGASGISGRIRLQNQEFRKLAEEKTQGHLKPSQVSRYWLRQGLHFILSNPSQYLKLQMKKISYLLSGQEVSSMYYLGFERKHLTRAFSIAFVNFYVILPFALVGLGTVLKRWRSYAGILAILGINLVNMLIFFYDTRFMLLTMPLVVLIAAIGLGGCVEMVQKNTWDAWRSWRSAVLLMSIIVTTLIYRRDREVDTIPEWQMFWALGDIYISQGALNKAVQAYGKVREITKNEWVPALGLCKAYFARGQKEIAASLYATAMSKLGPTEKDRAQSDPQLDPIRAFLEKQPARSLDEVIPHLP